MSVRDATVLITGASRGLGRLFALRAAAEGARELVLWGRDVAALEAVAAEARRAGGTRTPEVRVAVVDLARADAVDEAAAEVLTTGATPDVLVNNAGLITSNAQAWELDAEDAVRTMTVNALAPIRLVTRLLPAMLAETPRPKRLLNVASAAGLLPNPRMAAYAASKAAFLHWSGTLRVELARAGHRQVRVTTYNPAYIDTGMFSGTSAPRFTPLLSPERAAEIGWRAMLAGRPEAVAPASVHLARTAQALLPAPVFDALAGAMGIHSAMETFEGRS